MDRSRTDRILEDWDLVSSHAERPSQAPRGHTMRSSLPGAAAAVAAIVVIALAAGAIWFSRPGPLGVAGESPSPTPNVTAAIAPSASPSATLLPTASPTPDGTPSATPSDALGPYTCTLPLSLAGTAAGERQAQPTSVRVGTHEGYARIVFEYSGTTTPSLTIEMANPPFMHDPSGLPLTVAGSAFLRLKLDGVAMGYSGDRDLKPGYAVLSELAQQGDYEGVQTWLVGLSQPTCVRVTLLTSPTRLVVDLQH
ncbi:MAG: AMIN-like domain-containing (lipo)protein [Candidatus Limnocylindrales bacterium]